MAEQNTGPDTELAALRAELDRLDDALHDGLMQRAAIVRRIGNLAAKGPVKLRPGREAAILRRLLGRHRGDLPPQGVVRMWREIFAGSTAMQAPFTLAASPDLLPLAREHFGALTPITPAGPAAAVLAAVRAGTVSAGLLPWPADGTEWLAALPDPPRLYIVARLPFWADRAAGTPLGDAAVISATPPDPSGADRTVIRRQGQLVTLDGFVPADDPAIADARFLGAYAVPAPQPSP